MPLPAMQFADIKALANLTLARRHDPQRILIPVGVTISVLNDLDRVIRLGRHDA